MSKNSYSPIERFLLAMKRVARRNAAQYLAEIGRKGGQAGRGRAKARTTEQARAAAKARWDRFTKKNNNNTNENETLPR